MTSRVLCGIKRRAERRWAEERQRQVNQLKEGLSISITSPFKATIALCLAWAACFKLVGP
jgi:hypothetical protein